VLFLSVKRITYMKQTAFCYFPTFSLLSLGSRILCRMDCVNKVVFVKFLNKVVLLTTMNGL